MGYGYGGYGGGWAPYVSVAERRKNAEREVAKLKKKGRPITPIRIDPGAGRGIARTFWGKAWCDNLEAYSDYANRLPRGRTYVRNGSVIDLQIAPGRVTALVSGSSIYTIGIDFKPLDKKRWKALVDRCAGQIGSVVELLKGTLSQSVMGLLCDRAQGLFPSPREIALDCSCPDWADMCKHVAATLYGVGARLDAEPELFFVLRQVDKAELCAAAGTGKVAAGAATAKSKALSSKLGSVFGIEMDGDETEAPVAPAKKRGRPAAKAKPAAIAESARRIARPTRLAARTARGKNPGRGPKR